MFAELERIGKVDDIKYNSKYIFIRTKFSSVRHNYDYYFNSQFTIHNP